LKTCGAPAKFPQIVMSRLRVCGPKNLLKSHEVLGYTALGVGHAAGFGLPLPLLKSLGTLFLSKNQKVIASSVQSIAYTPPPLFANAFPKELGDFSETRQPVSPLV